MELRKTTNPGEYVADRKIKLILRNGQVLVRQGAGYESFANYMEALYVPFIQNIDIHQGDDSEPGYDTPHYAETKAYPRVHPSSHSKSPQKRSKSPRGTSISPPLQHSPTQLRDVLTKDDRDSLCSPGKDPTLEGRHPSLSPSHVMPSVERLEVRSKPEDRPKRLRDRVTAARSQRTSASAAGHPSLMGEENINPIKPFVQHEPTFTDCVPLTSSKSPPDQWGSPASISLSPVSVASFQEENSPYRLEDAIVLDDDSDEPRHRATRNESASDTSRRQGSPTKSPFTPGSRRKGILSARNGKRSVLTGTEDEAKIRALKKAALRKQFEEHRKQQQQEMAAGHARRYSLTRA